MHKHLALLLLGLGLFTSAFSAERIVVCEELYQEG
jgi:hypothetical protein